MKLEGRLARAFRIATLAVPTWLAWFVVFAMKDSSPLLGGAVASALGPLWGVVLVAVVLRAGYAARARHSVADALDLLTPSGIALGWTSAVMIASAATIGYASLAVVGLLGTVVFHAVVVHALFALREDDPVGLETITRRFVPAIVDEGDDVAEEVRFEGTRIPLGFRLFAQGRVGPRWPVARHVLEPGDAGGEIVVESEHASALRGVHDAEPLEVWLEDALGLTSSRRFVVGATRVTVLPRVREVTGAAKRLLQRGLGPRAPERATPPTEGLFHLREYREGDDPRRIHWVRSLAARELVVRMPDESPPDRPRVRIVLDTYLPEAFAVSCDTPAEVLDALVTVWLAIGRAFAASGTRVTLVAAVPRDGGTSVETATLAGGDVSAARRLGARAAWQGRFAVDELVGNGPVYVVSPRVVELTAPSGDVRWVLVAPDVGGVPFEVPRAERFPLPMGARENSWSFRRRVAAAVAEMRREHARVLRVMGTNLAQPPPGSLAALPLLDGTVHVEAIR